MCASDSSALSPPRGTQSTYILLYSQDEVLIGILQGTQDGTMKIEVEVIVAEIKVKVEEDPSHAFHHFSLTALIFRSLRIFSEKKRSFGSLYLLPVY